MGSPFVGSWRPRAWFDMRSASIALSDLSARYTRVGIATAIGALCTVSVAGLAVDLYVHAYARTSGTLSAGWERPRTRQLGYTMAGCEGPAFGFPSQFLWALVGSNH